MISTGDAASDPELDRLLINLLDRMTKQYINDPWRSARPGERPEGAKPSAREPTAGGAASRGEVGEV